MSIPAVVFALFSGTAIARKNKRWYSSASIIVVIAAVLACTASYMVRHTWWDSEDIPVLQEAIENDQGFEGTDEYDPAGDDHANLPEKSPRVTLLRTTGNSAAGPDAKFHIERWSANLKELRINSKAPLRVALRLLNYPAWQVEVNDAVLNRQPREASQIIVPVPAGQSHVVVRFIRTPDRTTGATLTAAALLTVVLLLFTRRQN
jgi:hypothetical protein